MPSLQCERSAIVLLCGLILAPANALYAQGVAKHGQETSLSGARVGDQTLPQIAVGPAGGYVVWQDNAIDGRGKSYGIAMVKLDENLAPTGKVFRVNKIVAGPQENPQVALLNDGAAAFVWQGGKLGGQDIFLRIRTAANKWFPATNDLRVSTFNRGEQSTPVITCLSNGNLAVAWCSLHQDKGLGGVFARIVTPKGKFVTKPFRVNEFTGNNQRNPAITSLPDGSFAVAWVSENQGVSTFDEFRGTNRVHVYGRIFSGGGLPLTTEFRVNTRSNLCANPSVAQWGERGFTIAWAEKSSHRHENWDICVRTFSTDGEAVTDVFLVNSLTYGDQFMPRIAHVGARQMVVWNSLGHDGSREGVFGRALLDGELEGPEFLVNTHTNSSQFHAAVAGNNQDRFSVVWSSFVGDSSFDIQGQQFTLGGSSLGETLGGSPSVVVRGGGDMENAETLPPPSAAPVTGESTDPNLRVSIAKTSKGRILTWNTEAGQNYQIQCSTNLTRWENLGAPRAAAAASDSIAVGNSENAAFYRVIRLP